MYISLAVVFFAGLCQLFAKAGEPAWTALLPFYNLYALVQIAGKPGWMVFLLLVPVVNVVVAVLVLAGLAQKFGKGTGFVLGTVFLPFLFIPILGFGSAVYQISPAPPTEPDRSQPTS